jgi:hypothetical protein
LCVEQAALLGLFLLPSLTLFDGFWALLGHFDATVSGELSNGFGECSRPDLHQKLDGMAVGATSKAMIGVPSRRHCERGCFLVVKWAQTLEEGSGLLQGHMTPDKGDDVGSIKNLSNRFVWNQLWPRPSSPQNRSL